METSILGQIAGLLTERKKHRRWLILIACLAVAVSFGTVAALRMMGQAMTQKVKVLDCRLEVHAHAPECYDKDKNLICGYADYVVHKHNDDCYASNGELACSLPEIEVHKHTDACYTEEQIPACGQEETAGHVHAEGCWTKERAVLVCQQPEHTHGAGCYDESGGLICGLAEHVHTDACYEWNDVLSCQIEEGAGGHAHSEACYETQRALSCGKLELHVHTEECYEKIDKDAEYSEDNRRLICTVPQLEEHIHSEEFGCFQTIEITGGEDAVPGNAPAQESEAETLGIPEELRNADITRTYEGDGYIVTAAYNEDAGIPEEAEFIAEQITPESSGEYYAEREAAFKESMGDEDATMNGLFKIGFYVDGEEIEPESAVSITIQLLDENGMPDGTPVTVVHFAEDGTEVLDGGSAESGKTTFEMNSFSEVAIGYRSEDRVPVHVSESYEYESDAFCITFHIEGEAVPLKRRAAKALEGTADAGGQETGSAAEAEGTEKILPAQSGNTDEKLEFTVTLLEEGSEEYEAFAAYAEPEDGSELLQLQAFSYALSYDGVPMDLSGCEVTAEIAPSETLAMHMKTSIQDAVSYLRGSDQTGEAGAEAGDGQDDKTEIVVSAIKLLDDARISEAGEMVLGENADTENETLTTPVEDGNVAVKTETRANPEYTVQYYANLDRVDKDSGGALFLIDTSGGVLPQNGVTPAVKNLDVNADGTIKTKNELTEVYTSKPFEYFKAPSIMYINELADNSAYELKEIWVLKHTHTESCYTVEEDGKEKLICNPAESEEAKGAEEEDKVNWDIYPYSESLHFTNSKKAEGLATPENPNGYVYIDQKAVLRLVYDTKPDDYNNPAVFYDYDISTGGYTEKNGAKVINTKAAGINSTDNCSADVKYAFGNKNAGTNYGEKEWNGNRLNMTNKNNGGYMGCTFELVSGVEADGNVKFNVAAPKVFGTAQQTGKTSYTDYSLDFICQGDTYTLSAVNGTNAVNLEKFGHPGKYDKIWTNNFWPMDSAPSWGAEGHDMKFGNSTEKLRFEPGGTYDGLPVSDDGQNHNSYFGMFYELEFELDEAYCGPLEYLFFGDDDMWVFLDGQLVCDIGGVHSSVGEYVNLWDYLRDEDGNTDTGKHTLKFYYTERGASGSTCWMQFTLPSVTNKQPASTNGRIENSLKVSKAVEHADTDEAYKFTIHFENKDGGKLQDDYSYTKYNKNNEVIGYDVIVHDGDEFTLKDGEYIMISYLPVGTTYKIKEVSESDDYKVSTKVDGVENDKGQVAEGETSNTQISVEYVNNYHVYELPETGGNGLPLYTMAGAACLVLGAGFLYRKRFRERGL